MKKKVLLVSIIMLILLLAIPREIKATTPIEIASGTTNYFSYTAYEINGETYAEITGYSNAKSDVSVTVPETIDGYTVTSIGEDAFYDVLNNKKLKLIEEIILPNTITNIGKYAFAKCTNLTSISLPDTITEIGISAFNECTNLAEIILPKGITKLSSNLFLECTNLKTVEIPDSVTLLENNVFKNCTSLTSITLPNSITTSTGGHIFEGCTNLKDITLSNKLTFIDLSFFKDCTSLKSIIIPSSVKYISSNVFENCCSLESVSLTSSTTSLYNGAFKNCTSLETISLPNTMNYISDNVFYGCTSLKSITIPAKVNTIDEYAFYGCTSLTDVVLHNNIKYINTYAFAGCTNLTNITIPSSVTTIGGWAFYGCNKLSEIFVPESAVLGINVFYDWNNTQTINIEADEPKESWDANWNANCNANINYGRKKITNLEVSNITIGEKTPQLLQVKITPDNAFNQKLEYMIDDESIATIDENGLITPISNGTTRITINSTDGSNISTFCLVTVSFKVTKITLNKTELVFNDLETTYKLTATFEPEYADDKYKYVNWYSTSSENIVTIDYYNQGTVIPLRNGTCQVYCMNSNGDRSNYCTVTVDIKVNSIQIDSEELTFTNTNPYQLTATVGPENANNKNVTWESSDSSIATVSETGLVTPINNGECEIICKAADGSNIIDKCKITVDFKVTSLSIEQSNLKFENNTPIQLITYISPSNANNKKLLWGSSSDSIARVDENGLVTPISNGKCQIYCSTTDGSRLTVTCNVEVNFKPTEIKLDKTKLEFETDDMQTLTATVLPDYILHNNLIWESTNANVATVEFGRITPIKYGTCEIICYVADYPEIQARCTIEVTYKEKPLYVGIIISYNVSNNTVEAIARPTTSLSKIPSGWEFFSSDGTYRKKYTENGTYSAEFVDIYGNKRNITFTVDQIDKKAPDITINKIYNESTNTVTLEAVSNEILGKTKPTWNLSSDNMKYSKVYNTNGTYTTSFEDIYGNITKKTFIINEIDDKAPEIIINQTYNSDTNTVTIEAVSNEILGKTKPTWILSEDKYIYTKTYNANGTYTTSFSDICGNETKSTFTINDIEFRYELIKQYNKNNNTVSVNIINDSGFQHTKPTWKISSDLKTYSKIYTENGTYTTKFTDTSGNIKEITIIINEIDSVAPTLKINKTYNPDTNTVTIEVISNEILGKTKPTWNLSSDNMKYSKVYNTNGTYTTSFADIYGNIIKETFTINDIISKYEIIKKYDDKTNTVEVSVVNNFGLQHTKPTWKISSDLKTYSKIYNANGTYSTKFTDNSDNIEEITISINEIDDKAPELTITKTYNSDRNTVTVDVFSNELLGATKPTWKLSEDKKVYSKTYNANGTYTTSFSDIYGNVIKETFSIEEIK